VGAGFPVSVLVSASLTGAGKGSDKEEYKAERHIALWRVGWVSECIYR
jgi:hypothetical protein